MICGQRERTSPALQPSSSLGSRLTELEARADSVVAVADTAWIPCTPSSAGVSVRVWKGRVEFRGTLSAPGTTGNASFVLVLTLPAGIPKPTTATSLPVACFRSGSSVPYTVGIIKVTPVGTSGNIYLCPAGGLTDGCYFDGISYPVGA